MTPRSWFGNPMNLGDYLQTKRHWPATQSISAQPPFEHSWQIRICGEQSLAVVHSAFESSDGHFQPQVPPRQATLAQPPPGQALQSSRPGQSLSTLQAPPHWAWPGVQCPLASQVLRTSVSLHAGSFGAHCVQLSPQALPAQGAWPEHPGIEPAQRPWMQLEVGQA